MQVYSSAPEQEFFGLIRLIPNENQVPLLSGQLAYTVSGP